MSDKYFSLKVQNELRDYEFKCFPESPLEEVLSVLNQMMDWFKDNAVKSEEKQNIQPLEE